MLLCQNHELIPPKWHNTYWPPLFVFIFKPQHSTLHTSTPTTFSIPSIIPGWHEPPRVNNPVISDSNVIRPLFTFEGRTQPEQKTPFPLTAWLVYLQLKYLTSYLLHAVMIEHDWPLPMIHLALFFPPPNSNTFSISLPYTVLSHSLANHWNQPLDDYRDVHRSSNSMPFWK